MASVDPHEDRLDLTEGSHYPRVAVVGAGIAGITVTRELMRRGWPRSSLVLLEATHRIGGRMLTTRLPSGSLLEEGAAYVHGTTGNPVAQLAAEAGVELKEVALGNPWMSPGASEVSVAVFAGPEGEPVGPEERREASGLYLRLTRSVQEKALACRSPDERWADAVEQILREDPFPRVSSVVQACLRCHLALVGTWMGCSPRELQLAQFVAFAEEEAEQEREEEGDPGRQATDYGDFPGPHAVVLGGMEQLTQAAAGPEVRACLRLGTPVTGVTYNGASRSSQGWAAAAAAATVSVLSSTATPSSDTNAFEDRDENAAQGGALESTPGRARGEGGSRGEAAAVAAAAASGAPRHGVSLALEGGEVVGADAAVLTVPLSVLKEDLRFEPPLPEHKLRAMESVRLGAYEKLVAEFDYCFWPTEHAFLAFWTPQPSRPGSGGGGHSRGGEGDGEHEDADEERHGACNGFRGMNGAKAGAGTGVGLHSASPAAAAHPGDTQEDSFLLVENLEQIKGVPALGAVLVGRRARHLAGLAPAEAWRQTVAATPGLLAALSRWWTESQAATRTAPRPRGRGAAGGLLEPPEPKEVVSTRWLGRQRQRGSYCFLPVGGSADDVDALQEPVADRLFFAGEATDAEHMGSVHGAIASGERAAAEVAATAAVSASHRARLGDGS